MPATPQDTPRDGDTMGGFAKGLRVIEAFGEDRERLTIAEVARAAGLDRAVARRCLLTLVQAGYAEQDGRGFALTPRVLRLGYAWLASRPLPRLLQPWLERIAEATQDSCSAAVLEGTEIVYVARASQRRVLSIGLNVGSRLPAYCTSMGRVLLAALPEAAARAILEKSDRRKLTPATRTGIDEIMVELPRIRDRGHAMSDEELEIGLRSIAIPIQDGAGRVVAAMNVGGQAARLAPARMTGEILPLMRQAQDELRRQVG